MNHITICICTYKRPELLRLLLTILERQETQDQFNFSIVIVDNDKAESARQTVETFACQSKFSVNYYVEPEQNIALARNKAVEHADGDFLAFIDDDERPIDEWLLRLYNGLLKFGADGVLGPVKPFFTTTPPDWMVKAGLFERPNSANKVTMLNWTQTGTGNALVRRAVLSELAGPFNPKLGSGGEDQDFFRRAIVIGKVFMWCEDAVVYEIIPVERTHLSFQLKRALLRGKASLSNSSCQTLMVLKSLIACGLYTIMLPAFMVLGRHVFVRYLVRDFDHLGRILAGFGFEVIREKYIVE